MKPEFNNKHNEKYSTKNGIKWDSRACAVVTHVWCQYQYKNGEIITYVLIGKRGTGGDNIGLLNIPCGYIDWNENLEQASRREIWEETGLNLLDYKDKAAIDHLDQPWFVNSEISENRQNIAMHTAFVFVLDENNGDQLPDLHTDNNEPDEVEELFWMTLEDIMKTEDKVWAFNHKERVNQFFTILSHNIEEKEA